eukprot:7182396-Alexandrium_andersonii.AAC.1
MGALKRAGSPAPPRRRRSARCERGGRRPGACRDPFRTAEACPCLAGRQATGCSPRSFPDS